jgi:hypothetical protein
MFLKKITKLKHYLNISKSIKIYKNMEYQLTYIKRYNDIVEKKTQNYKNLQRKIWGYHFDILNNRNENILRIRSDIPLFKQWYNHCMWELKFCPSIRSKVSAFKKKIEKKIDLCIDILLKTKYLSNLNMDVLLTIVQYIY